MESSELINELQKFSGTEHYYTSTFKTLLLTDGIHYLREQANCYWLIDIVESVQHLNNIKHNASFIVWKIAKHKDSDKATVTAWNDTPYDSDLLYKQEIGYTDFPLEDLEFYQCDNVLLLKSEY
jgi:hypothetical protein